MAPSAKSIPLTGRGGGLLGLFAGASYPLRALRLFWKIPRLRPYVLLPILINLVLGVTVYAGLLWAGLRGIDWFITHLPGLIPALPNPNFTLPSLPANPWHLPSLPVPPWLHLPQWSEWHWPAWVPALSWPHWLHLPHWSGWSWPAWIAPPSTWQWPHWLPDVSAWQLPDWLTHPAWASTTATILLVSLLKTLLTVLLLIATGFIFLQFGVLLGAPWYGKLSEELERHYTGQVTTIDVGLARDVGRAIAYELKKLVLVIGLGLPLFLFNVAPGLGTAIATLGGLTLTTIIVCMDFMDAAVERRRPRFRDKLRLVRQCLPASAGFGLVCVGLISIPLLNLLSIPLCVAAGTLFFCDRILPFSGGKTV